ncbi:cation:proton antiporter [Alienimonas californiensis]|uniref:cation:proton antiporter n=1 Tax=Alienimonas californiensis TaxID=2527989 RepID=UPI0013FD066B|nr:sodium:proton antiporter [Alienimonas californiensis]
MSPLLYLAGIVAVGVAAQWTAWRLRLPAILLLLAAGFAFGRVPVGDPVEGVTEGAAEAVAAGDRNPGQAGRIGPADDLLTSDGATDDGSVEDADPGSAGQVEESDPGDDPLQGRGGGAVIPERLLTPAVALAVAVILFEGGLSLKFRELREIGSAALGLCTAGAAVTGVLAAIAAKLLVFDTWQLAILAGSIFTVTGPTVIIPLLRQIRPNGRVGAVAKWEGIVIDPVGAVLAVLAFEGIVLTAGAASIVIPLTIAKVVLIGGLLGAGLAWMLSVLFQRHWVPDYLQNPVALGTVLLAFAASNALQSESGLVTVTVMGVWLANQERFNIEPLVEFKENLGVLLISVLFVVLAGQLEPQSILDLGWGALAFIAFLVLVVRPAAVFLGTLFSPLSLSEKTFLAWLAPRGIVAAAVASVFALELRHDAEEAIERSYAAGVTDAAAIAEREWWEGLLEDSARLVPLTFSVISASVALYGLTAGPFARRLGLAVANPQGVLFLGGSPLVRAIAVALQEKGFTVRLIDSNRRNVSAARLEGLDTLHGNVLSEKITDRVDPSGLGRVLAMTPNDEVNSLAAQNFATLFGRSGCYQLCPHPAEGARKGEGGAERPHGRALFREGVTYKLLQELYERGARVKETRITQEFDYPAFLRMNGAEAVVLFRLTGPADARTLRVNTANVKLEPTPGDTLLSLVPPDTGEPPAREAVSAGTGLEGELDDDDSRLGLEPPQLRG